MRLLTAGRATREEAFTGVSPELTDSDASERFVAGNGPIFDDLAALVLSSVPAGLDDLNILHLRRQLMKQYAEMAARGAASFRTSGDQLAATLEQRLRRTEPDLAKDPAQLAERARLLAPVAIVAMRTPGACRQTATSVSRCHPASAARASSWSRCSDRKARADRLSFLAVRRVPRGHAALAQSAERFTRNE